MCSRPVGTIGRGVVPKFTRLYLRMLPSVPTADVPVAPHVMVRLSADFTVQVVFAMLQMYDAL
jgi:hypothetical protein